MTKRIECQRCQHEISYDSTPPKFCSECGCSLSGSHGSFNLGEDETIARTSKPDSTFDDVTVPPDQTGPVTKSHIDQFELKTVGPYRLVRQLGQGGMGTVFEAQHSETGRNVALKLLSPDVRGTDEMVQRFRRESQIAASINHPRSTFVYEAGDHDGQLFIAMELMGGGTLKEVVEEEGPLPVGRAVDYIIDIIDGLSAAHSAGIVHRDLKPSNSFIDTEGRIKVGDFGLAKSFVGDSNLTATGTFMGTPQYAAPEQIRNADIDERTDIYALGGMLFFLLTGRAPFLGNPAQVISSIASDTPPSVREVVNSVPRPLARLISQMLEKDPSKRPLNLNILRDGLLPYSTQGAIAAEPGVRMAAFFMDVLIVSALSMVPNVVSQIAVMVGMVVLDWKIDPRMAGVFIVIPSLICYFAICEHYWGRTPGKWLMGLRVIDKDLELPSWTSAFLRASFIPGLTSLLSTVATIYLFSKFDASDLSDALALFSLLQALGLFFWIPLLLLILSTGRKSNGYQGLHGVVSGTRVVRISGGIQSRQLKRLAITSPILLDEIREVGNYSTPAAFSESDGSGVFLGTDKELDRPIWIFEGLLSKHLNESRRNLLRPNRLRVIKEGKNSAKHWYATESVPGIPLSDSFGQFDCDWHSFYPLIRDLAVELDRSEKEGLVPDSFSMDHCWLDQNGHLRVLDHVVVPSRHTEPNPASSLAGQNGCSDNTNCVEVISNLLDRFMGSHDYPAEVIDFRSELEQKKQDPNVLQWIAEQMNRMTERLVSWNSSDRTGMLAITLGFETYFFNAIVFLTSYLYLLLNINPIAQCLLAVTTALGLAFSFGYLFDGGLAIRMMSVSVRKSKDQSPASKIHCGLRNVISWLPWISMMGLVLYSIYHQAAVDPTVMNVRINRTSELWPLFLIGLIPAFVALIGVFFAIGNPKRGIADWIVGTRLMRK